MSTKKNTVIKVIAYILLALIVIGGIGLIAKYTGGFTSDFKTFYVSVDGKDIMSTANGYKIDKGESLTVDVKYTFSTPDADVSGYSVKVIPNAIDGKDFDFTLDGDVYSFQMEEDLTAGFDIVQSEKSFTITPKGDINEVLKACYPNSEISDCKEFAYENMYSLVVTSYNGQSSVVINFCTAEPTNGIELDKEVIIF